MPHNYVDADAIPEVINALPMIAGFNDTHKEISNELVRRVIGFLNSPFKIKNQRSAEAWNGDFEEALTLEFGDKIRVEIVVKTLKE